MNETMLWVLAAANVAALAALVVLLARGGKSDQAAQLAVLQTAVERLERRLQEEMLRNREELAAGGRGLRQEVGAALAQTGRGMGQSFKDLNDSMGRRLSEMAKLQFEQSERIRGAVEGQLKAIQEDNAKKLEEMRRTVDEKLHATLEKRLGDSFQLVSERLEQVHKGLGEMQTLAAGVGDLKRVMTNVKTRGIWGEIQLGNLLEQVLTPEQYEQNVATKKGSSDRVEYAVKLPGRDQEGSVVWLPIDAKFPQEDYQRLLDAQDQANPALVEEAARALELRVRSEAKDIAEKYLDVPQTTDFAVLFLPTEGLYAEVLRRPGLCEGLMQKWRVVVAGPTTLGALLNSLQLGFRTLAIERRSSEVWALLGAVKTEFGKFGDLLDKTSKKLQEAGNTIHSASVRSRAIERKLRTVQELPAPDAAQLLELEEGSGLA